MEDSYLPTNLDSLNMEEENSILRVSNLEERSTATTCNVSEESNILISKKLQENCSENLIET